MIAAMGFANGACTTIAQARLSVNRLGDILNARPEPAPSSKAALPAIKGQVSFRDVTFRYRIDGPKTLAGVHRGEPGGRPAVGKTASG